MTNYCFDLNVKEKYHVDNVSISSIGHKVAEIETIVLVSTDTIKSFLVVGTDDLDAELVEAMLQGAGASDAKHGSTVRATKIFNAWRAEPLKCRLYFDRATFV